VAGCFCLITPASRADGAACARRLADAMPLFPWQRARLLETAPGRAWLGAVVNSDRAADLDRAAHTAGPLTAVVEGWLLRSREDCGAEAAIAGERYAEAVLAAYRTAGPRFAALLEGQFNAIVHDRAAGRILIGNGRHEHSPLYVWSQDGAFAAATSLGPLGACGLFAPRIDARAAAVFLGYGQLFADTALLQDVRVLPQASVCEFALAGGAPRTVRYWDMGRIAPIAADVSPRTNLHEVAETLRAAGQLAVRRPGRYVVGLSGGLDSRLCLAAVLPHLRERRAWTFGSPGAADLVIAGRICEQLGFEHLTYGIDPPATATNATDFVSSVDGCVTASYAFQLDRARSLREAGDVVLNGFAGEVIVRGGMLDLKEKDWLKWGRSRLGLGPRAPHPRFERNRDLAGVLLFLQRKYGRPGQLAALTRPACPSFAEIAGGELERLQGRVPAPMLADAWILENRGRRWTMMGIVSDRHFYADGSVFYDYDFQDRSFATPVALRRGGRLYAPLLRLLEPALAAIPYGDTGLPIGASWARIAAIRLGRRLATRRGRDPRVSTGVAPAAWSRGELRAYYGDLIGDARTQGRAWWDGEALRERWRAHCAGELNFTAELGRIATVEHFARRWTDHPA